MNGRTTFGIVLTVVGVWIALHLLGISLGPVISFLFPLILIGIGFIGLRNNSKLIGGLFIAVGAILLLVKLSKLIFVLLAIGLAVWGISMLITRRKYR
ncbi:LiaF transmembrane domain-containing protein [Paenibacillus abyssi]|uniref:LiaF transmembrane domain-containing protein n=1 Tax=Paenibacillus abyssi TaxID=1340531 RepID=A0A917G3N9_9BACL|nr:hypothetical protein [Paenibacillus abyssi]GGG21220.1 hypothetical protein GCM10010916_42450 [Paenibacillus abyssi]